MLATRCHQVFQTPRGSQVTSLVTGKKGASMGNHSQLRKFTIRRRTVVIPMIIVLGVSLAVQTNLSAPKGREAHAAAAPTVYQVPPSVMRRALGFCNKRFAAHPHKARQCKRVQRIKRDEIVQARMRNQAMQDMEWMDPNMWVFYYAKYVDRGTMSERHRRLVKTLESATPPPSSTHIDAGWSWALGTYLDITYSRKLTRRYANEGLLAGMQAASTGLCAALGAYITPFGAVGCTGVLVAKAEQLKRALRAAKRDKRCVKVRMYFGGVGGLGLVGNVIAIPRVVNCRK